MGLEHFEALAAERLSARKSTRNKLKIGAWAHVGTLLEQLPDQLEGSQPATGA